MTLTLAHTLQVDKAHLICEALKGYQLFRKSIPLNCLRSLIPV